MLILVTMYVFDLGHILYSVSKIQENGLIAVFQFPKEIDSRNIKTIISFLYSEDVYNVKFPDYPIKDEYETISFYG